MAETSETRPGGRVAGILAAVFAFVAWGLLPIFWKELVHVPASELLAHRIVSTLAFTAALVTLTGRWREVREALRPRRAVPWVAAAAATLAVNWFTFIYAVNAGRVVECSLGYFINPLVSVVLGFAFLRERFTAWQVAAIALAAAGVLNLTFGYGEIPWIALTVAASFGLYGLIRKTAGYEAVAGLLLESAILVVPAALYLAVLGPERWKARPDDARTVALLVASGAITAVPLIAFAFGARRIRLATVGFIQYLTPTGMLLLGVLLYREPFTRTHAASFAAIWAGLAAYSFGAALRAVPLRRSAPARVEGAR